MTAPTLSTVWILECLSMEGHPLLSYSPAYTVGATPDIYGVKWWRVSHQGAPLHEIDKPGPECPYADLILFRLAQAYSALQMASNPGTPPAWKA